MRIREACVASENGIAVRRKDDGTYTSVWFVNPKENPMVLSRQYLIDHPDYGVTTPDDEEFDDYYPSVPLGENGAEWIGSAPRNPQPDRVLGELPVGFSIKHAAVFP